MDINADFSQRASVDTSETAWVPSPMAGVDRRMLDRIGDEVARATSIVRYAKGSAFPEHTHGGGEEFIVLEGTFQDEHGDYPAGTYVRNPPTTHHIPRADDGCTIFVKLWQFDADDRNQFSVDINTLELVQVAPGVSEGKLHTDAFERVVVEHWDSGISRQLGDSGGAEMLVLEGSFKAGGARYDRHDWLRLPKGDRLDATAGEGGVKVWIKTGHLDHVRLPAAARS